FDQPLWTVGASGWEKTRNVIRSATESVVPGYMGFAGLITPEAVADYLPSYRWRQISRAKAGKTAEGIQTKEDPVRKTVRGLGSVVGIPLHPLNLQNLSSQVQKSIK
ncbi:MAG: hypothetical protein U1D67_09295, partial [Dehalococcoidia bacterium]|nr:hypothetical protein [Dehalococcoidia bacterium]